MIAFKYYISLLFFSVLVFSITGWVYLIQNTWDPQVFLILDFFKYLYYSKGPRYEHRFIYASCSPHSLKIISCSIFSMPSFWLWPSTWSQVWNCPPLAWCWCSRCFGFCSISGFRFWHKDFSVTEISYYCWFLLSIWSAITVRIWGFILNAYAFIYCICTMFWSFHFEMAFSFVLKSVLSHINRDIPTFMFTLFYPFQVLYIFLHWGIS